MNNKMFNKNKTIEPITDKQKLRNRALYWLSKKEYSIHDFAKKLDNVCEISGLKNELLEDFIKRDWLNEQRYMASFVRMKLSAGLGLNRIKQELQSHGIKSSDAELYLEALETDWFAQAQSTYDKKYGSKPLDKKDFKEKAKRFRFMQYRGFSPDQINYAIEHQSNDW